MQRRVPRVLDRLFLCHYSALAAEIAELGLRLRARGIVPWLDTKGGFQIGDDSQVEARRAIREDCWGFLFYASTDAFRRPFIRNVEVPEALAAKRLDTSYTLFAVPRGIGFEDLRRRSLACWNEDLAAYYSGSVTGMDSSELDDIAHKVLLKLIDSRLQPNVPSVHIQLSTRDLMPDAAEDLLRIDLTAELREAPGSRTAWTHLLAGIRHVKSAVARAAGRPRIAIHGSKHLTAALLAGRVLSPFDLDIRTGQGTWSSDGLIGPDPLRCEFSLGTGGGRLVIEVATGTKNTTPGVDAIIRRWRQLPSRLRFRPSGDVPLDAESCRGAVEQIYRELEAAQRVAQAREFHLFAAAPQALLMLLGKRMKSPPPIHVYEWIVAGYQLAMVIPAGVL
jgi:SMODS-associated and fused to various effectors sensor domain